MSKTILYVGTSDVRQITSAQWTAIGITEPTRRWEQSNSFEQVLSDTAAAYCLAQGPTEFVDEQGLTFPLVMNDSYNNQRFEQRMKKNNGLSAPMADWRSWNVHLSRRSAAPVDVFIVGDSIGEGWTNHQGTAPQTTTYPRGERDQSGYVGRAKRLVQLMFNADGRGGQWVPGGAGWWGPQYKFSAMGSDIETNDGLSLRGREMTVANANPATITVPMCDGMTLLWQKINFANSCDIRVLVDGAQVTQLATFDGALAANATEVYQYQWSGTRGDHTFSIQAVTNGGSNTKMRWTGAYFHDGDMNSGVRIWNGSHFGYSLSNYVSAGSTHTSAIGKGFVKPRLLVIALGTNDNPANFYADALAYYDMVNASLAVAGQPRCALAFLTPPANNATPNAQREVTRAAAYQVAAERNGEVWEWNELEGSVAIADGNDPFNQTFNFGGTKDNTHPGGAGHRMIGDYLGACIIRNSSPMLGVEESRLTHGSGRKDCKVIAASGTTQTFNAGDFGSYSVILTNNCTITLAGSLGNMHNKLEMQLKQDGTGSRTVTFSPTVKWAGGTAYVASTAANSIDRVQLETFDAGTTWIGTFSKGYA